MKLNLNNTAKIKLSLGCLALLAVTSLAADVLDYVNMEKKVARSYHDLQLGEKLAEASMLNRVLHGLEGPRAADAKDRLSWQLASDLSAIRTMADSGNARERGVARYVVGRIARAGRLQDGDYPADLPAKCVVRD